MTSSWCDQSKPSFTSLKKKNEDLSIPGNPLQDLFLAEWIRWNKTLQELQFHLAEKHTQSSCSNYNLEELGVKRIHNIQDSETTETVQSLPSNLYD